jgi:hypothetical protein
MGPLTYGALVNHVWGLTHDGPTPAISSTYVQPFLSRGLGQGMTATIDLEASCDCQPENYDVNDH